MGRKDNTAATTSAYVPPHARRMQTAPGAEQGIQPRQPPPMGSAPPPWQNQRPGRQNQPIIGQPASYNTVSPPDATSPYMNTLTSSNGQPSTPPPRQLSIRPVSTHPQAVQKPFAASNRPGSRYQPPQTRSQRRNFHDLSADHPLPSIETPGPSDLPPLPDLPIRKVNARKNTPRYSRSATPADDGRPVTPPLAPTPSEEYLKRAQQAAERLNQPRKLLLLLDLNGTLLYRPRLDPSVHGHHRREHILRPGAQKLVSYLFDNHAVMIYTSAMERNAKLCVDALLKHLTPEQRTKLIDIRPREKLGLTRRQLDAKVQVYKPLEPIWALDKVHANGTTNQCVWDESNTVLLDDSIEKAKGNPYNLLQIPEFTLPDGIKEGFVSEETIKAESSIMQKVEAKLEELKWEISVTRKIREWQEKRETLVEGKENEEMREQLTCPDVKELSETPEAMAAAAYPTPESTGTAEVADECEIDGGARLRSPSPITEGHFDFVDSSRKDDANAEVEALAADKDEPAGKKMSENETVESIKENRVAAQEQGKAQ